MPKLAKQKKKINSTKANKKQLGQFFTQNSDYILQGMEPRVKNKKVTDPFAGNRDLMKWATKHKARSVRGSEIDDSLIDNKKVFRNDSILNPQKYDFVLTNPPYLNINKASQQVKETYFRDPKNRLEDLYQYSLLSIMNSNEGIVIVPINFLSAQNSEKVRRIFFSKFEIVVMNYFKHQVFEDTTYNVIAFYYKKKKNPLSSSFKIKTRIFPEDEKTEIELNERYGWAIGGELISEVEVQENYLKIRRLTEADMRANSGPIAIECAYNHLNTDKRNWSITPEFHKVITDNIILLKAIDSGSSSGKIALEDIRKHNVKCLVSKPTSRHMIYLLFGKRIPHKEQKQLIEMFNKEMARMRTQALSLFLTNYRDNDRKRVGFDFVYKFLNYLYIKHINSSISPKQALF